MKLEIDTVPAIYTYVFYWGMMLALALVPFFLQDLPQMMALCLLVGAITLLLSHNIRRIFKDINSISISLSPTELIGSLLIILGAIGAGVFIAA